MRFRFCSGGECGTAAQRAVFVDARCASGPCRKRGRFWLSKAAEQGARMDRREFMRCAIALTIVSKDERVHPQALGAASLERIRGTGSGAKIAAPLAALVKNLARKL